MSGKYWKSQNPHENCRLSRNPTSPFPCQEYVCKRTLYWANVFAIPTCADCQRPTKKASSTVELKRPCTNTQFPDWKLNVHKVHCEKRTTDSKHKQNKVNKQNVADLERNGDWRTPGASFDWFVYRTIVVGTHQSDRVNSSQMSFDSWFQMCWCSVSKQ